MAGHTLESQKLKKVAIDKILGQMVENIEAKKAGKKISSSQLPKMYLRMARLLAGTEDAVFMDTIEDLVSKNASGDKLKNALRGISERQIPTELKRTLSDRLHHGIPLELMDTLMKQDPEVMLEFLVAAEDDGRYFGDSRSNVDNSLQEQAHTGAKDKATTKYRNYPYELKVKGDRQFSAHPFGTNKGTDKSLDKLYGSGKEMYDEFLPAIVEAENELQFGIRADQSRRVVANKALVEQGVISPGQDFWADNVPKAVIREGRVVLAQPEIGLEVAASFNPYTHQDPKDLTTAGVSTQQIADFSAEQQKKLNRIKKASIDPFKLRAAGLGAGLGLVSSEEGLTKALEGDLVGAAQAAGTEMAVGLLGEGALRLAAPKLTQLAPKVMSGVMRLAPVLGPLGAAMTGLSVGNVLSDWTEKRRNEDPKYTRNTQYGYNDAFFHSEENPVTIQAN